MQNVEIHEMTNKQAAEILDTVLKGRMRVNLSRANGKGLLEVELRNALCKAVELLERTPDEKPEKKKCCRNCNHWDCYIYRTEDDDEYEYLACDRGRREFDFEDGYCDEFEE